MASIVPETSAIKVQVHPAYMGNPNHYAVEFAPREGEMRYWRIAYPRNGPNTVWKGIGPTGGAKISTVLHNFMKGPTSVNGIAMIFFGAGDAINPNTAAYVIFTGGLPKVMAFGCADKALGQPSVWQMVEIS